jgi:phosphate starvation-inducible PhoH-like protein
LELTVTLEHPELRSVLFGPADAHLRTIRQALDVQMYARGEVVKITGSADNVSRAAAALAALQRRLRKGQPITPSAVSEAVAGAGQPGVSPAGPDAIEPYSGQAIVPKSPGQRRYLEAMRHHDLVFCTGPAGTGKTYLAVAMAVNLLKNNQAKRLILARPAVEAGEKLGFLPGDMQAKVNPYLRPLFDALNDMMDFEQIRRFMANDIIEVIPLAFMRGRTLNESIIILDEAQNTTGPQMLMFLTRLGHGSKMIITGDDSQVDLPENVTSGLIDAQVKLRDVRGLAFVRLDRYDIVRHRLVQDIVDAYGRTGDERQGRLFREDKASRPRPAEASPPGANMTGGSAGGDFGQAQ